MITDETLTAYIDGEAGADEVRAIESELDRDPALRARLAKLEGGDRDIRTAFDMLLERDLPDRLVEMVNRSIADQDAPSRRRANHAPMSSQPRRARPHPGRSADGAHRNWRSPPAWVGWALAAQVALVVLGVALIRPAVQAPAYHALGATPPPSIGNLLVVFSPDTTEAVLRTTLQQADARIVDGPTPADAYVLAVPAAQQTAALKSLRAHAVVEMAEPIGGANRP